MTAFCLWDISAHEGPRLLRLVPEPPTVPSVASLLTPLRKSSRCHGPGRGGSHQMGRERVPGRLRSTGFPRAFSGHSRQTTETCGHLPGHASCPGGPHTGQAALTLSLEGVKTYFFRHQEPPWARLVIILCSPRMNATHQAGTSRLMAEELNCAKMGLRIQERPRPHFTCEITLHRLSSDLRKYLAGFSNVHSPVTLSPSAWWSVLRMRPRSCPHGVPRRGGRTHSFKGCNVSSLSGENGAGVAHCVLCVVHAVS